MRFSWWFLAKDLATLMLLYHLHSSSQPGPPKLEASCCRPVEEIQGLPSNLRIYFFLLYTPHSSHSHLNHPWGNSHSFATATESHATVSQFGFLICKFVFTPQYNEYKYTYLHSSVKSKKSGKRLYYLNVNDSRFDKTGFKIESKEVVLLKKRAI